MVVRVIKMSGVLTLCTILYLVLHKELTNDFSHMNEKNMSLPNWTYETSQKCLKRVSGYCSITLTTHKEVNRNVCEDETPICHAVCEKCVGEKDSWDSIMDHYDMGTYKIEPKGALLLDTCHMQCNRKCNSDYVAGEDDNHSNSHSATECGDWGWLYDDD